MPAATLTSKGQITIPLAVRTALGLHTGTKVDFVRVGDGFKVVPLRNDARSLKGRFAGRASKPVTVEAMDQAIAAEATLRFARSKR
jgi:antitoxin PrlF